MRRGAYLKQRESSGKFDAPVTLPQVSVVEEPGFAELALQCRLGGHWEHRSPIPAAFGIPDDDLEPARVHVLHAEVKTFVEA